MALRAFGKDLCTGSVPAAGRCYWLRWRTVNEFAQDAHSLPLQILAELGLVGLALLAVFLAGSSRRRRARAAPAHSPLVPWPRFVAYIAHSPLDWDWQMPALTMIAMLAGALLAIDESPARGRAQAL